MKSRINLTHAILLIVFLSGIVYVNALTGEFVLDDWSLIVKNKQITSLENIPGIFSSGLFKNIGLYRPLVLVFFLGTNLIFGLNPLGYHLVNILLHIGCSILILFILRKLINNKNIIIPVIGAAVFAVHPVHSESVSWISGIPDLLLTLFLLLSFLFYQRFRESNGIKLFLLSSFFFTLSLFSKETAVIFPLVIIIYDLIVEKNTSLWPFFCFILLSFGYLVIRFIVLGKSIGGFSITISGFNRMFQLGTNYIKTLFIPVPLDFYLKYPAHGVSGTALIITAGFLLIFMTALVIAFKKRILTFSLWWLLISLTIPLSLAFYFQPVYSVRLLYLPSVGFSMFIAFIAGLVHKKQKTATLVISLLVITGFSALTINENQRWKSDEALFSRMIKRHPETVEAYIELAKYYEREGQPEQSISILNNALGKVSDNEKPLILENIAIFYGKKGNLEKSMSYYEMVLNLKPGYSNALMGMGNIYFLKKNYVNAIHYYNKALLQDQNNYTALYNTALSYENLGDVDKALYYYREFLRIVPGYAFPEQQERVKNILQSHSRN